MFQRSENYNALEFMDNASVNKDHTNFQEKRVKNFVKCHEPEPPDVAASFTLVNSENIENISSPFLVITLTSETIPKDEKLEPCFDLRDPKSADLISTKIPIVRVSNFLIIIIIQMILQNTNVISFAFLIQLIYMHVYIGESGVS